MSRMKPLTLRRKHTPTPPHPTPTPARNGPLKCLQTRFCPHLKGVLDKYLLILHNSDWTKNTNWLCEITLNAAECAKKVAFELDGRLVQATGPLLPPPSQQERSLLRDVCAVDAQYSTV